MTISDEEILKIFNHYMNEDKRSLESMHSKPEFTLENLVGKTINGYRKVKNPHIHPVGYGYQGKYFNVLEFSDGSILLTEEWGAQEENLLNSYYFDGKQVHFSSSLFETRELIGGV